MIANQTGHAAMTDKRPAQNKVTKRKAVKRSVGRPTAYTEKLAISICTRIAGGESLRNICKEANMPAVSTVLLWVVTDREGFSEHYTQAQDAKGSYDADKTQEVYEALERGEIDSQQARVMFDILRWSAERRAPKRYGSKQQLDHTSSDGSMTPPPAIDASGLSNETLSELMRARRSPRAK